MIRHADRVRHIGAHDDGVRSGRHFHGQVRGGRNGAQGGNCELSGPRAGWTFMRGSINRGLLRRPRASHTDHGIKFRFHLRFKQKRNDHYRHGLFLRTPGLDLLLPEFPIAINNNIGTYRR